MKAEVYKVSPSTKLRLNSVIEKVWYDQILAETLQNLIKSMPFRVKAVINARGGSTKY